jgi:NAD(P)-dependent dehydrogenase (short-subunit alcohol dehydrogenase family)
LPSLLQAKRIVGLAMPDQYNYMDQSLINLLREKVNQQAAGSAHSLTYRQTRHPGILVNNAAFQRTYDKLTQIPEKEFDQTYRTNVYGTFFLTQAALPEMKPGGVILNSCSIEAYEPKEQLAAYASTKAALVSLTKSFSKECIEPGIRVNGVAPGPVCHR